MTLRVFPVLLLLLAPPAAAQTFPQPRDAYQRIQHVAHMEGEQVVLTMLPDTPLTVVLQPGDRIAEVQPGPEGGFTTRVSAERDSFIVLPLAPDARSSLAVTTAQRSYRFIMKVDYGPEAAVLVRFDYGSPSTGTIERETSDRTWHYRLRGDREVRPQELTDDGIRTYIRYGPGQVLPAVFAIGPTGDEEVVNGYMRDGVFEIDRVYSELVFRIDREKATARRNDAPEERP